MTVPSMPAAKPVPGRGRYLVALVVFLIGMAGMGVVLYRGLSSLSDALTQVVVPGEKQLSLTPGSYTIFHELHSTVDGKIYDAANVSGLSVSVTGTDGSELKLEPVSVTGRYEFSGRVGVSAFQFNVANAGDYTLSARYSGGNGPETVLAVGQGFVGTLVGTILGGLAFAFAGVGIALFLALTTFFRRRRAKREV